MLVRNGLDSRYSIMNNVTDGNGMRNNANVVHAEHGSSDNKSVHTESRVARHLEIKVVRHDPVTSIVIRLKR